MNILKNILITGGAGFIGSNFLILMAKKYPRYTFVNFDKLTYAADLKNLKEIEKKKNYFFIQGDISDKKLVKKIIQKYKISHIINFAAESHVDRSIVKPDTFIRTNIIGTHILLQCALESKIKKFVQISTDEVYGSCKTGSCKETDILNPSSPYSASKASADLLTLSYFYTYGLPIIITRSSNNYGPRQYPEKMIPLFIKNLLKNKKIPIYGRGENIRNWIHVEDNCKAIDVIFHKGKNGEIYNIGGDTEKKNKEVAQWLIQELKKPKSLMSFVNDRPGHDFRYSLNTEKIEKEIGFKPKIEFEEGLRQTIKWYKNSES